MAFVGKEVAEKLNENYPRNIATWKPDGNYSDKALIDLEKTSYLKNRERRLVCCVLGIAGKSIKLYPLLSPSTT